MQPIMAGGLQVLTPVVDTVEFTTCRCVCAGADAVLRKVRGRSLHTNASDCTPCHSVAESADSLLGAGVDQMKLAI